jgi:integrase
MRRVQEATPWRVDDPLGQRKALRYAEEKSREWAEVRGPMSVEAWGAWVPAFFEDRYRNSPKSLVRVRNCWDLLREFLSAERVPVPAALDYNIVIRYLPWRTAQKRTCGKPISRNTAITELKILGLVCRQAVRRGYANHNPCERLGLKRDPAKEKPELTNAEIALIRAACAKREGHLPITERWMSVSFEIALHQGCRLRETQVQMTDVDEAARVIVFHAKGRDGVPKIFPSRLHNALLPLMAELRAAKATQTCKMPTMASKDWWALRQELGIGHTCFHSTRVTVVTRMARNGVPEQQAMAYVGHASRLVHRIYQRLRPPDLRACEASLDYSGSAAASGTPQTPGGSPTT